MLRTQIYLPKNQMIILKKMADEENISVSEVIRRCLEKKIEERKPRKKKQNAGDFLLSLEKEAKRLRVHGPKDLASNVDKYLYGEDFR